MSKWQTMHGTDDMRLFAMRPTLNAENGPKFCGKYHYKFNVKIITLSDSHKVVHALKTWMRNHIDVTAGCKHIIRLATL